MNPDEAIEELREYYNMFVQDERGEEMPGEELEVYLIKVLEVFDDLDNHIITGGQLPKEWQR